MINLRAVLAVIIIVVPGPVGPGQPAPVSVSSVPLVAGTGGVVRVSDATSLASALASAQPGQTIEMADGTYRGQFTIARQGAPGNPTTLRGSRNAVIDGGPASGPGYDLHLSGANYWQLIGFTVTGGQQGIVTDRTSHTVLSGLDVGNTGARGVDIGNFSESNVLQDSVVHDTGKARPGFGEGLHLGTAWRDWATRSGGKPDLSNGNKALNNTFKNTAAENIDVNEETSGGLIAGNAFDGSGLTGVSLADSVLALKGTDYRVLDNVTSGAGPHLRNGFQTQVITGPETSGCGNTFLNNVFNVRPVGAPIALDQRCGPAASGAAPAGAPGPPVSPGTGG